MVVFVSGISGKILIYISESTFESFKILFVCAEMNNRSCFAVTFFAVPCEV